MITGNSAIVTIPTSGFDGQIITLISNNATWSLVGGGNLRLSENFVAKDGSSITLVCVKNIWYEQSRSKR